MNLKPKNRKPGEASFTIVETLIALAIMLPVIIESVGTQGTIINGSTYMHRVTEATWLAKSIMSQVEYNWRHYPFKDLERSLDKVEEYPIEERDEDFDYTYKIDIQEWKIPLFEILLGGGVSAEGEEGERGQDTRDESSDGNDSLLAGIPGIESAIDAIFDGHILKIAKVEVFWPEGARQDSVTLSMLLTNQKALDAYIGTKSNTMTKLLKKVEEEILGKAKEEKKETSAAKAE